TYSFGKTNGEKITKPGEPKTTSGEAEAFKSRNITADSQSSIQHRSKTGGTRGSSIQDPEDNVLGLRSSPSIIVSAPPSKRPRGRPPKKPLQPEKPRTALADIVSDPAIISASKPIITVPSSSRQRALSSADRL
ncbi:hypothetical protein V496_10217, partial [Pseudogymnoascus sp. VKM F-4515 (FW-2607)]